MTRSTLFLAAAAAFAVAAPAFAVGLGPLANEGKSIGPDKAFFLTLINPYEAARKYRATAYDMEGAPLDRIEIRPAVSTLGAKDQRRIVVIARGLAPGEELQFKVCAALAEHPERTIHARVCSKLTARRLAARNSNSSLGGY